jgi:hypothetical protein
VRESNQGGLRGSTFFKNWNPVLKENEKKQPTVK